jgi:hypothetical protein
VHSRYERRLLDTAAAGQEVLICLTVRRFLCRAPACPKVTFAEQVRGLTSRYARRTPGLAGVLQAVALALGGRAGARLTGRLAAAVSRMTLLRLIRALPAPAVSTAPRVLGVDLSRPWDYPDWRAAVLGTSWWRLCGDRPEAGQVGIITGFPGRRAICRAGGSGRA